jgi:hypothetical protein
MADSLETKGRQWFNPKTAASTPSSPTAAQVFGYPVEGAKVSQVYGNVPSNKNISYQSGTNLGTDFAAAEGSDIKAPAAGKVVGVNQNAGAWGNQVIVEYPGGVQLSFNHMSGFGDIKKGQAVNAGDVLGKVGRTGQTTGAHLDMEATVNGTSVPLSKAFQGYQFDKAYGGAEAGAKGAQAYNRSQNKFYAINNLSKSTSGSVYKYNSGTGTSSNSGVGAASTASAAPKKLGASFTSSTTSASAAPKKLGASFTSSTTSANSVKNIF